MVAPSGMRAVRGVSWEFVQRELEGRCTYRPVCASRSSVCCCPLGPGRSEVFSGFYVRGGLCGVCGLVNVFFVFADEVSSASVVAV